MRCICFFLLLITATSLWAQEASISGRVLRRGVVPMAYARVTYRNSEGGAVYETLADSIGNYVISSIPLSAPERRSVQPPVASMVSNSVGSSRSFYFTSSKPLPQARIYDLLGREVAVVMLKSVPTSGLWISSGFWDGRSAGGVEVANGIYFAAVPGAPQLHTLKFIHLRGGLDGSPPQINASVLQALGVVTQESQRSVRRTLDDDFTVTITPDSLSPRFAIREFSRSLHDGDNGEFVDTVWSAIPHRVLFVGNSYTYVNGGVDVHFRNLYLSAHPDSAFTTSNVTSGGFTLGDHWNFTPTRSAIDTGRWDVVVLQEQSQRPQLEPDSFYYYARLLNGEILHARSETAFYMTWARQNDPPMIEPLAAAYDSMGRELGAVVSPCGRAFQRVCTEDTTINLYDTDGSHPSVWGTYLVCCVFYAALMQENPVGISYVNDPRITDSQRRYLQTVAYETVNPNP